MEYIVSAITNPFGELADTKRFTSPEKAVEQWCKYQKKYPSCVSIQPENKAAGINLINWVYLNLDKFEAMVSKSKVPYRFDWMKEQIASQVATGKCKMQWDYDQITPFCEG